MRTRFAKFALSGLAALSLSFAPVPASAGSKEEDFLKALAGLAILGVIVKAASDRSSGGGKSYEWSHGDRKKGYGSPYTPGFPGRVIEGEVRRPGQHDWWQHREYQRVELPPSCRVQVRTSTGVESVYSKSCLQDRYRHARYLPDRCAVLVRTSSYRTFAAYAGRCLAKDGWRVAQR